MYIFYCLLACLISRTQNVAGVRLSCTIYCQSGPHYPLTTTDRLALIYRRQLLAPDRCRMLVVISADVRLTGYTVNTTEDIKAAFIASNVYLRIRATSIFQTILSSAPSGKLLKPEEGLHRRCSLLGCYAIPTDVLKAQRSFHKSLTIYQSARPNTSEYKSTSL